MGIEYKTEKDILASELFDGRLKKFGVYERFYGKNRDRVSELLEEVFKKFGVYELYYGNRRCLTDGENLASGCVSTKLAMLSSSKETLRVAIRRRFWLLYRTRLKQRFSRTATRISMASKARRR